MRGEMEDDGRDEEREDGRGQKMSEEREVRDER